MFGGGGSMTHDRTFPNNVFITGHPTMFQNYSFYY